MSRPQGLAARERIIVALDVPDAAALEAYLDQLGGAPVWYKVGLELFVADGERAIAAVKRRGGRVFLDLKLHDIPETVGRAVGSARRFEVDLLTIHTSGGLAMMERAVEAAAGRPSILGVTVLTSLAEEDLRADGIAGALGDAVARRAALAARARVGGLVCSPMEVARLRAAHPELALVVPGIRPAGAAKGDQKRTGTPADTLRAGADWLVVGRPLRDAPQPAQAFADLVREIESAAV